MIGSNSRTPKITFGRKDYKTRQKIFNFLFFLTLSIIFWLLKVLDNSYTTFITYPIKYIQYRSDIEMVGHVPEEITLNVTGMGYELLKNKLTARRSPIILHVVALNLNKIENNPNRYFVLTHYLKENIQRQLGTDLTLNYIQPDTLWYDFSPVIRKKIRVLVDLDIKYVKQYMQEGEYIVQPDSITVWGPKSIIDTLTGVSTEKERIIGAFRSFSKELSLIPIPQVRFDKPTVNVTVPVEKFTEATITVPIRTIHVPDSFILKVFPSVVQVNYWVSLKNYPKIKASQFNVFVDFNDSYESISGKLKVRINNLPYGVKLISYAPKSVEFIIESNYSKKNQDNSATKK